MPAIPVIDLFAGPGGLGEGFSSVIDNEVRAFDIRLSIEKDAYAHQTLEWRSFFRKFYPENVPAEFYDLLREKDSQKRKKMRSELMNKYPRQAAEAREEAWRAELGNSEFPAEIIDNKISKLLNNAEDWVLIGGPPCQAYSLVGRSRVGGIDENDHRVYLYKEYLRIIAQHHPTVFVMENVKGLLSARVDGSYVFNWILRDLQNPSSVFPNLDCPNYKIYSLSTPAGKTLLEDGQPYYKNRMDYLIRSEDYGVPQKRHRVILLGVRDDLKSTPGTLQKRDRVTCLKQVIEDLPKIRSGINRSFVGSEVINGKKRRIYQSEPDSDDRWSDLISKFRQEIISWNGFAKDYPGKLTPPPRESRGGEFIKFETPSPANPLYDWYLDENLGGVCNHEARSHLLQDLKRYLFSCLYTVEYGRFPRIDEFEKHSAELIPDHANAQSGKFSDRFRVQLPDEPATTVTSHISKDGHYFIHYDSEQCRSLTVREAARIQTFPDNYLFWGPRTAQYHQVGNAVPPYLAMQIGEVVLELLKA